MANKKIVILLVAVITIAGLILTGEAWLPLPGTFLLVKDNIGNADCIVPLAGEAFLRFRKATELYKNGYAKNIVVSLVDKREEEALDYNFKLRLLALKDVSEKEFVLMAFKYFGVDQKAVHITDKEATSTYDEAVATKRFMLENGLKSLILVTSTYHTRRALMIFKSVFKGTGIKIYNCTVPKELHDPYHWWLKERDVKAVSQEYLSIIYNIFYHLILKKDRTSFDTA